MPLKWEERVEELLRISRWTSHPSLLKGVLKFVVWNDLEQKMEVVEGWGVKVDIKSKKDLVELQDLIQDTITNWNHSKGRS